MIVFRHKGQWVNFINGEWYLSDVLDFEQIEDNIYEFVNEIMQDLKCEFDEVEIYNIEKI